MLKRRVEISLCLLLHVSVQLDHPQGAYAEPCQSYNIVELFQAVMCVLRAVLCVRTQQGTQYTHHSLKYLLPQRRISYNDVLSLINSAIL